MGFWRRRFVFREGPCSATGLLMWLLSPVVPGEHGSPLLLESVLRKDEIRGLMPRWLYRAQPCGTVVRPPARTGRGQRGGAGQWDLIPAPTLIPFVALGKSLRRDGDGPAPLGSR